MADQDTESHANESFEELDQAIAQTGTADPSAEYIEYAQEVVAGSGQQGKQIDPATILAIANLILQLIKFFQSKKMQKVVGRAHDHPHSIIAMIVRKKIQDRLPDGLQTPPAATGVIKVCNTVLSKANPA